MFPGKSQKTISSTPWSPLRQPLRVLALAALPALLLHGIVLGGLPSLGTSAAVDAGLPPVRVRAVAPPMVDPSEAVAAGVPSVVATQRKAAPSSAEAPVATATAVPVAEVARDADAEAAAAPLLEVAAASVAEPAVEPPAAEEPLLLAAANEMQLPLDDVAGLDSVEGDPIPIYSTAFAPSQTLRYDLQRGMLSGTGELSWRRDSSQQAGAGYELQLLAKIGSLTILTQISKGGFDKAGLAPLRFTDQRLRGSIRAANFQRQRNLITFSGPSVEFPLIRGVQDRLSWMVQVPAILAANPGLASAGQRITLYVVGARGDASVWDFRFEARERITTKTGEVDTVKFSRQPRKPFDTLAEVWLDPARQYMPLRARIGNPEDGAMLELRRID